MGEYSTGKREQTAHTQRRGGQLSSVQVTFAVILAVGLILAINFSSRIASGRPLLEAYLNIQTEIARLQDEQEQLQRDRDFALSDAYVEQWARESGKMIRAGERLVIPVPSGITLTPTPAPPPVTVFDAGQNELAPWELWWILFFDGTPPRWNSETQ
jgi:hypothetical protein